MEIDLGIGNEYGGLVIKADLGGKCYWQVDGYGSWGWEEIPPKLFDALAKQALNVNQVDND